MMTRSAAVLFVVLCWAVVAKAGLYNPAEPLDVQLPNVKMLAGKGFEGSYGQFRNLVLMPLQSIGAPKVQLDSPLRLRYMVVETATAFGVRGRPYPQQLSVSEYLIRRNDLVQASRLLENLREERNSFLALANLGTAYQLSLDLPRALDCLEDAAAAWPVDWNKLDPAVRTQLVEMRWGQAEFDWYRKVEKYHLKLVELRSREKPARSIPVSPREKAEDARHENVDALFDDAFVFDGDNLYTAGKLPSAKTGRLPADALAIVQQLLVWMPHDRRLTWLLGEIYNARGDVLSAKDAFKELSQSFSVSPYRPDLLKQHYQVLSDWQPPRTPSTDPVPKTEDAETTAEPPLIHWRSLTVGFGAGIAFAFMAYWQVREILRRKRGGQLQSK